MYIFQSVQKCIYFIDILVPIYSLLNSTATNRINKNTVDNILGRHIKKLCISIIYKKNFIQILQILFNSTHIQIEWVINSSSWVKF